jgi:hypothetical protein
MASVKNFQLIHSTPMNATRARPISPSSMGFRPETDIIFQMGKVCSIMYKCILCALWRWWRISVCFTSYRLTGVVQITNECFNVDFKHPLSMLQAFAIAVSRWVLYGN